MSMLGNSLLNEIVLEKKITEPGEVLDMLRVKIIMALKQETAVAGVRMQDGMDMNFCRIDTVNNVLHYAAANNPLWLVRGDQLIEFPADKQPVGVSATDIVQFSQREIKLQKGDAIYSFTDGYADQFGGEKGKKFKYKQLEDLLLSNAGRSMPEQKEALTLAMDNWVQGYDQVDDILIIGIRIS
jgi:serine phosphatase RsbU (regulator of sigma subunit)